MKLSRKKPSACASNSKKTIEAERLDVEIQQERVIIRVREQASFALGSADLLTEFMPMMQRIAYAVAPETGQLLVAGHTDDLPINSTRFRSNWELSASRATSVVHALLVEPTLDPDRVRSAGYGEYQPIADNATPEGRTRNRRVEITIEPSLVDLENNALERLIQQLRTG